jgi:hypothetical protein
MFLFNRESRSIATAFLSVCKRQRTSDDGGMRFHGSALVATRRAASASANGCIRKLHAPAGLAWTSAAGGRRFGISAVVVPVVHGSFCQLRFLCPVYDTRTINSRNLRFVLQWRFGESTTSELTACVEGSSPARLTITILKSVTIYDLFV